MYLHIVKKIANGLIVCFCLAVISNTNASSLIPPQLKFRSILTDEIEKLGYINDITQDQHGFLWFGAVQGLARYDGYEIKHYRHSDNDPNSLPINTIQSLAKTRSGELWIVTTGGVCQYMDEFDHFECLKLPDINREYPPAYYHFYEHTDGNYWISTSEGLKIYNPLTKSAVTIPTALQQELKPWPESEDNSVTDIVLGASDDVWLATYGGGVLRYNFKTGDVFRFTEEHGLGINKVRDLLIDANGKLWVATLGGGLFHFNAENNSFNLLQHSTTEKQLEVWSITQDKDGLFWIGDGAGVYVFDPVKNEFAGYTYKEGSNDSPGNFVTYVIFHDRDGGTWAGYFPSGVDRVDRRASQFKNYSHDPGTNQSLADGGVLSTLEDDKGNLWVGCGFGLSYLDRATDTFITFKNEKGNPNSLSGSTILAMDIDRNGAVWVGAWDKGLNKFDWQTKQFKRYIEQPNIKGSLWGREPWAILVDSRGTLWVGTEKGLNRYRPDTDDFEKVMPSNDQGEVLTNLYLREVYEDSKGRIWLGSFDGAYVFDPAQNKFIHHYKHNVTDTNTLSSGQITAIFEDVNGNVWLGTYGAGLNKLDPITQKITRYSEQDGLLNASISGIVGDAAGDVWISTYHGLYRLNSESQKFTRFFKSDGPVGDLYNRNSPSQLSSGELVFGSTRGVTIFNPQALKDDGKPPKVVLTNFSIFNKPVNIGQDSPIKQSIITTNTIDLNHEHSVISFVFSALDFNSPSENQYKYRMLGFEDAWNNVGTKRDATYTNLDPGKYVLQVLASNNLGVWSDKPHEVTIYIAPPWWNSRLAWVCYVFIALAIIYRMVTVYRNKLESERENVQKERAMVKKLKEVDLLKDQINRELDQKVEERTKELQAEHKRLTQAQQELQQLNARLEEMSVTDQLTGLNNRRFLYQSIEADISLLSRLWSDKERVSKEFDTLNGLTFVLIDVDHFKKINDQFGHALGDSVLVYITQLIKANVRDSDYVIRWGGEEFVIVLRHLPREASFQIAHRLHKAIQNHKFENNNGICIDVNCSMGIAYYPFFADNPQKMEWEQVLNLADQALYSAKQSGRDCWVSVEAKVDTMSDEKLILKLQQVGLSDKDVLSTLKIRSSLKSKDLKFK